MSGAKKFVKKLGDATLGITGITQLKKKGAFGMFEGPDSPGAPPAQEDPQAALQREAENTAIAGDIAARNAQARSSTLGSGARFLRNNTVSGQNAQDILRNAPVMDQTIATASKVKKPKKKVMGV